MTDVFVCFDSLRPSQHFYAMTGRVLLGSTRTKQRNKSLAKGHNTVHLVRLEPETHRSRVKQSTTESPHSSYDSCLCLVLV